MSIRITRGGTLWSQLGDRVGERLEKVIDATALRLEQDMMANAPVDTSALRNSIHCVTAHRNDYTSAASIGGALRPEADVFPEVLPRGPLEGIVAVAMGYGAFVEFGTAHSPAQPFFTPAVEAQRKPFAENVAEALLSD